MIELAHYWMSRDAKYRSELTPEIAHNAEDLVGKVNNLLAFAEVDGVQPGFDQVTRTHVASGWRPSGVNERTSNAATASRHITGQGIDLQDGTDRGLARWCLANLDALEDCGLWMERPQWTGGADPWVHLQSVPPGSGKRVYIPSTMPPRCAALPGEDLLA